MPGWLALIGGAEWSEGCTFDADLLAASGAREVVVLPTAAAYEQPMAAINNATGWFAGLGVSVRPLMVLNRRDAQNPAMVAELHDARFIYLSGGSPMHLKSVIKDSPLWFALAKAWHGGAVLAGSSAGAMALCDPMIDPRGGAFTIGLGLVENLAILPHAQSWSTERLRRTLKMTSREVVVAAVDERTALLRSPEGTWTSAGEGSVTVHVGHRVGSLTDIPQPGGVD